MRGSGRIGVADRAFAATPSSPQAVSPVPASIPLRKPRLLDLFCGAGGAAMGYFRAGFDVVGVDINPQPNYPFEFIQADALALDPAFIDGFDAIHASPPCQDYSALKGLSSSERGKMIDPVRDLLCKSRLPWIIENVVGSDLRNPITLCGSSFGLGVWRHRKFETSFPIILTPQCRHALIPEPIDVTGTGGPFNGVRKTDGGGISRKPRNLSHAREVMGIDWMNRRELSQSVPPAYTQFIGEQLLAHLNAQRIAA
jgi:DNA (cytosine-5)-methyltransferase 1